MLWWLKSSAVFRLPFFCATEQVIRVLSGPRPRGLYVCFKLKHETIKGAYKHFHFPSIRATVGFETEKAWGVWGGGQGWELEAKGPPLPGRVTPAGRSSGAECGGQIYGNLFTVWCQMPIPSPPGSPSLHRNYK